MKRKGRRPGNGESPTSPRRLEAAQQAAKAISLRMAGASYEAIAKELGYNSLQAAHAAVMRTLDRTLEEPAEQYRKIMIARLNRMLQSLWKKAIVDRDLQAHDRVLRIIQQLSKITGLDMTPQFALQADTINLQQNTQTNINVAAVDLTKLTEDQLERYNASLAAHGRLLAEFSSGTSGGASQGPAGNGAPPNGSAT